MAMRGAMHQRSENRATGTCSVVGVCVKRPMTLTENAAVVEIDALELRERLEAGQASAFFDVRTPYERELASIVGSRLLDEARVQEIEALDRKTPLYFH